MSNDIAQLAKEMRELIDYGCRDDEIAEYIGNWQANRATDDELYPDCDTCGKPMAHMPWHYSRGDERHLHACDQCWPKVNSSAGAVPEGWREAAKGALRFADNIKMVREYPKVAAGHITGLSSLILSTPPTAPVEGGGVPKPFGYIAETGVEMIKSGDAEYAPCFRADLGRDWLHGVPVYLHPHNGEQGDKAVFVTGEPLYVRLAKDLSGSPDETFVDIETGDGFSVRIERIEDGNDWLVGPLYEAPKSNMPDDGEQGASFQDRVAPWMQECFGPEISADKVERNHRFLEESLELVQSLGCTKAEATQLVDYVYGRPAGDPPQEVGGVRVTLAALCLASGMDQDECAETELARIWTKVPQIRAKQAGKPKHSPLPQHVEGEQGGEWLDASGTSSNLPEIGQPVMGYHPDWVDEDFCKDGIRECFLFGDGSEWQSGRWDGYSDLWIVEDGAPALWHPHPNPPTEREGE